MALNGWRSKMNWQLRQLDRLKNFVLHEMQLWSRKAIMGFTIPWRHMKKNQGRSAHRFFAKYRNCTALKIVRLQNYEKNQFQCRTERCKILTSVRRIKIGRLDPIHITHIQNNWALFILCIITVLCCNQAYLWTVIVWTIW